MASLSQDVAVIIYGQRPTLLKIFSSGARQPSGTTNRMHHEIVSKRPSSGQGLGPGFHVVEANDAVFPTRVVDFSFVVSDQVKHSVIVLTEHVF